MTLSQTLQERKYNFKESFEGKLSVTPGLFIGSLEIDGRQQDAQKNLFKHITSELSKLAS